MIRLPRRRSSPASTSNVRTRDLRRGIGLYLFLALILVGLAVKPQITNYLDSGDTITAEFESSYKLRPNDSSVKVGGVTVGNVTKVEDTDHDTVVVTMKVDPDALDTLGSEPTARIEPRTILGGRYAIELHAGGTGEFTDEAIPLERTGTPVELDRVLEALPATSREALQGVVKHTGPALQRSGKPLSELLATAPDVLAPGGQVVDAARGERPDRDLPELVTHLEATADVLTRKPGQLDDIARNLYATSQVLADHQSALAVTLRDLPATIHNAHVGLVDLTTLATKLEPTARSLRPVAPEVVDLVDELDPALDELRPLLTDLRPVLSDLRPAVRELVPVAGQATGVLDDLEGPVLDRLNGPVADFVLNPWRGTGPFKGGGAGYLADHKFYEELGYLVTNLDRGSMAQDRRGSTLTFQAGVGLNSVDGLPFDMESIVKLALQRVGLYGNPELRKIALERAGVLR